MVKESEDEIISKRKFQKGSGVDLGSFLIDSEPKTDVPVENLEIEDNSKEEVDIAIGEIAEIFTRGDAPSRINRDGTVDEPPEIDSVTETHVAYGEYDLVARIDFEDEKQMANSLIGNMRIIPGVQKTETLIAVEA